MQHQRQTMPQKNAAQVEAIENHVSFVRRKALLFKVQFQLQFTCSVRPGCLKFLWNPDYMQLEEPAVLGLFFLTIKAALTEIPNKVYMWVLRVFCFTFSW